jgi:Glyoxalase-like domain
LVSDLDAAVDHAISVRASMAPVQPQQRVRVLFDPAGHPFCLFN